MSRALAMVCLLFGELAQAQAMLTYPGQLPGGGPAASSNARSAIVAPGDSITWGRVCADSAHTYTVLLAAATGRTVVNLGVAGNLIADIRTRWEEQGRYPDVEWCLVEASVNNLRAGWNADDTWAALAGFLDAVRAEGQKPVIFTIIPFAGSPGATEQMETYRLSVNASIKAYAAVHGAPVVDLDAVLGDGATPPKQQDTPAQVHCGDYLHPDAAGNAAISAGAKTAMGL